jgi:hypothetical protein
MQIIKTLSVTALALVVAGSVVSAAPAKYTFIHLDSKGHEKVLSLDCAGVLEHFYSHPGEDCIEENWVAFEACNPV